LRDGLGPVRFPELHAEIARAGERGVQELGRQIVVERHRRRLAHPDEDDAQALFGRKRPCAELARERRVGALDEPGHALPGAVEDVAMVRTGRRALELAETERESRPAMWTPIAQRDDLPRLVPEEHEIFAEHLEMRGRATYLARPDARIPVLPKPQLRAVVERADLRRPVRLPHRALRVVRLTVHVAHPV